MWCDFFPWKINIMYTARSTYNNNNNILCIIIIYTYRNSWFKLNIYKGINSPPTPLLESITRTYRSPDEYCRFPVIYSNKGLRQLLDRNKMKYVFIMLRDTLNTAVRIRPTRSVNRSVGSARFFLSHFMTRVRTFCTQQNIKI